MKIQLENKEVIDDNSTEQIAMVLLARFGLLPRKKDANAKIHKLLLEIYERKKKANRERAPEAAVVPVDEMGVFAGISRQTMYEYLHRWLDLAILKKTTFVSNGKVITGYELNGQNLEGAFRKAETVIKNHLDYSFKLVDKLQNEIKKEKIIETITSRKEGPLHQQDSASPEPREKTPQASETPNCPHNASQ
ncbi:MAG: hypothetical protein HY363_05565 [Candidatus Aenigmarchaeota archaeon]|nr:hypothetical protein [Candidatus Aenigmarchaeota archaeon]